MAFKEASRAETKALIGLYGGSGSGKTLSALYLARGLVGPEGKIFMIDTESRRGELYADVIPGGYLVDQLTEPFSPDRYMEKIQEAEAAAGAGPACLVIDSLSHEWEGLGGVCNMAETIAEKRASKYGSWDGNTHFGDWKKPKVAHKQLVLKILGSSLHIIVCLRADFKSHQIERKDFEKYGITAKTKTAVVKDEFQTPIQDSKFIYEMTIHGELDNRQPGVLMPRKCPIMLKSAIETTPLLSVETGAAIKTWFEQGAPVSEEEKAGAATAREMAECGAAVYEDWFKRQSIAIKTYLARTTGIHEECKAEAVKADQEETNE